MNRKDHKKVIRCLNESVLLSFRTMQDGQTETQTWRCPAKEPSLVAESVESNPQLADCDYSREFASVRG